MTSGDESSEGFLQRWSRRKLDAEPREANESKPADAAPSGPAEPASAGDAVSPAAAGKPEFDLSSLPSLESITAGTDIRAFLNPGVPAELARAALRRAWTADATIRDFVGLSENAWDFNDPTAIPGFGPLEAGFDVKQAVSRMFGEVEKIATGGATVEQPPTVKSTQLPDNTALSEMPGQTRLAEASPDFGPPASRVEESKTPGSNFVSPDNIAAAHKEASENPTEEHRPRRNHGGALPQ
jgi:hypothetical protein